ncbi:MAG: hypothetical protein ACI38Q_08230 [Candidatus Bruticola sp.]
MIDTVFNSNNEISTDELPGIPKQSSPMALVVAAMVFGIIGLVLLLWPSAS